MTEWPKGHGPGEYDEMDPLFARINSQFSRRPRPWWHMGEKYWTSVLIPTISYLSGYLDGHGWWTGVFVMLVATAALRLRLG